MSSDDETNYEEWQRHNESFRYEPPDRGPEWWSQEEYNELYDRVIQRRVKWICNECGQPMGSLKTARQHISSQHREHLIGRAKAEIEDR